MLKVLLILVGSFVFVISFAQNNIPLRLVIPSIEEFSGFPRRDGEIVYDESNDLLIYSEGAFHREQDEIEEQVPSFYKQDSTTIKVFPGKIVIDDDLYVNTDPITCSYSSSGPGGVDGSVPSEGTIISGAITHLYLIPDEEDLTKTKFSCILGHSLNGPIGYLENSILIGTFWSSAPLFTSSRGHTFYSQNNYSVTIPAGDTSSSCVPINTSLPLNIEVMQLVISCNSSSFFGLYSDSSCSEQIYGCYGTNGIIAQGFLIKASQTVFYQGVLSGTNSLIVRQTIQDITE